MEPVCLRVDMAVDQEKIRPAIIVEVEKHGAPTEIASMSAESGRIGYIGEGSVAVVVIERRGVVGKVGAEEIEIAVAVVVGNGGAHAGLLATVRIVGHPGQE